MNIVLNTGSTLYEFDPVTGAQLRAVPLASPPEGSYGDISYNDAGTVLYGISYPSGSVLYTIDPATGAYSDATPLAGAALSDTATEPPGSTSAPGVWNGLSPESNGKLLLGSDTTNQIYELDPATGDTSHFALFPTGIVSAGDFLTLPNGKILAVGIEFASSPPFVSIFYLIDPTTGSMTEIGTGPQTFGAAQSGGDIYLATASGAINVIAISSLPSTTTTAPLPTKQLSDPGLGFYGATSIQDVGRCNIAPTASYTVAKKASTTGPVQPGQAVTYTVTVANTGSKAYTPLSAGFSDDLSRVTDDAEYVAGSAKASAGTVTVDHNTVTWLGPLSVAPAAGSTVTVTYQVNVTSPESGDRMLTNTVRPTGAGGACAAAGACTTTTTVQAEATEPASPSGPVVASPPASNGSAAGTAPPPATAPSPSLAATGVETENRLLVGGLLVAIGGLIVIASRHRLRRSSR